MKPTFQIVNQWSHNQIDLIHLGVHNCGHCKNVNIAFLGIAVLIGVMER